MILKHVILNHRSENTKYMRWKNMQIPEKYLQDLKQLFHDMSIITSQKRRLKL